MLSTVGHSAKQQEKFIIDIKAVQVKVNPPFNSWISTLLIPVAVGNTTQRYLSFIEMVEVRTLIINDQVRNTREDKNYVINSLFIMTRNTYFCSFTNAD